MTRLKSHTLPMLLLFVSLTYMLFGFGYTGIVGMTQLQPITLGILLAGAISAGVQHLRGRWQFYRNPLVIMVVPWVIAIFIATLANPHVWRISLEAIGFVSIFIGLMTFFAGALANRAITRAAIEEAFLLFGFVVMAVGYIQLGIFFQDGRDIPRMGSLLGNANFYGMFLLIVIVLALYRVLVARQGIARVVMGVYALAALVQLWITGSRGAQLGVMVAIGLYSLLWMLTPNEASAVIPYRRLSTAFRSRMGFSMLWLMAIGAVAGGALAIMIVSHGGFDERIDLWSTALRLFGQKPLTGQGLYSFGERSLAFRSIPPYQMFSHAHSIVFQVMSDLGIPGLIALGTGIVVGLRAIVHNRRHLTGQNLWSYDALVAVLVGLSVHQMVDLARMFMALVVLIVVVTVITPVDPQPMTSKTGRRIATVSLTLLAIGLTLAAMWRINLYTAYMDLLADINTQVVDEVPVDYAGALPELETLVSADPQNRAFRLQYAVWAGQLAYQTNVPADIQQAITAHEAVTELMPNYGLAWSNLSALYWQLGDLEAAANAAESGRVAAPQWPVLNWQLAAVERNRSLPLSITRVLVWFSRSNIQLVYLYDVLDPLLLPQVADSFVRLPGVDILNVANRLLSQPAPAR